MLHRLRCNRQLQSFKRLLSNTKKKEIPMLLNLLRLRKRFRKLTSWREIFNLCRIKLPKEWRRSKSSKIYFLRVFSRSMRMVRLFLSRIELNEVFEFSYYLACILIPKLIYLLIPILMKSSFILIFNLIKAI